MGGGGYLCLQTRLKTKQTKNNNKRNPHSLHLSIPLLLGGGEGGKVSAVNPAIWGSAHRCLTPQQPPAPLTPSTEPGPPHNPPRRKTNARPVPMPTEAARSPPGAQHRAGGRCLHPAAPLSPAAFPPTSSSSFPCPRSPHSRRDSAPRGRLPGA